MIDPRDIEIDDHLGADDWRNTRYALRLLIAQHRELKAQITGTVVYDPSSKTVTHVKPNTPLRPLGVQADPPDDNLAIEMNQAPRVAQLEAENARLVNERDAAVAEAKRLAPKQRQSRPEYDQWSSSKAEELIARSHLLPLNIKEALDEAFERALAYTDSRDDLLGGVRSWLVGQIRFRGDRLTDRSLVELMGKQVEKIDAVMNISTAMPSEP